MPPGHDPYDTEPAQPILAHELLSCSKRTFQAHQSNSSSRQHHDTNQSCAWDLKEDINTCFRHFPDGVFRHGKVIGFSRLRRNDEDNDDEYIGNLPRALITAHLSEKLSSDSPRQTSVYIVHPANCEAFSPTKLFSSLLSMPHQPPLSRDEAISCLDSVQLLPVFDFAAAAQAISEVSDILYAQHERPEDQSTSVKDEQSILFLVVGLDTLTEGVVRASNTIRGTAVLTTVLRTLTQLTRSHGSYLSVMLVNTNGVGTTSSDTAVSKGQARQSVSHGDSRLPAFREEGTHSIFQTTDMPLFPSLLMRTMDHGIDTHMLLSKVRGADVIEVIKDRVGDSVGKWTIWQGET